MNRAKHRTELATSMHVSIWRLARYEFRFQLHRERRKAPSSFIPQSIKRPQPQPNRSLSMFKKKSNRKSMHPGMLITNCSEPEVKPSSHGIHVYRKCRPAPPKARPVQCPRKDRRIGISLGKQWQCRTWNARRASCRREQNATRKEVKS